MPPSSASSTSSGVQVFLRVRPSPKPSGFFERDDIDQNKLIFRVPKNERLIVNNSRTTYGYQFNGILDEKSTQEDVFRAIGSPAVRNALDGFNSTVFAYGQTGSGKTFTITGGAERYVDRGIIPRSISLLYSEFNKRKSDITYACYVSYLELYNEKGFDLLAEEHIASSRLEDMQRVTMLEDEDGNYHFKNLSVHQVSSEEEALNLLFLGDTNRAIGETDMNESSSRSHCIFTIMVEGRRPGSDSVTRSKLNLVDLAGSERVHRTSSTGQTLKEAQYINTSLFYLEMVIVALHEKGKRGKEKTHVPYRNSMMTSVLRDSLGGNCKTMMIATISPEAKQTDESISTCSFAQRVALVKNAAQINEELEPELVIRRLKAEIHRLQEEIKFLKGENEDEEDGGDGLLPEQRKDLVNAVNEYVDEKDNRVQLRMGKITLSRIREVQSIFKEAILRERNGPSPTVQHGEKDGNGSSCRDIEKQVVSLKRTLQQRDHEIAILVNMVKQGKGIPGSGTFQQQSKGNATKGNENLKTTRNVKISPQNENTEESFSNNQLVCGVPRCNDRKVISEPSIAFSWFKERYPGVKAIEENKNLLKVKYAEAKETAELVQKTRTNINYHKTTIEQLRRERALDAVSSTRDVDEITSNNEETIPEEEMEHRNAIETQKKSYKINFHNLRELKSNIEHIQHLMEKSGKRMQSDFDIWYREMCGEQQETLGAYARMAASASSSSQENKSEIQCGSSDKDNCAHECKVKTPQIMTTKEKQRIPNMLTEINNDQNASVKLERKQEKVSLPPGVKLTGNKEADEDIIAFYKAKEALLARNRNAKSIG